MIITNERHQPVPLEKSTGKKGWRIAGIISLCIYALLGWLRFYKAWEYQQYLSELNIWPRPLYIILSGLAIGFVFSVGAILTLLRVKITPGFIRISGMLFLGWLWFDHLWLGTREAFTSQASVLLLITVTTLIVMFIFIRKKDYFRKNYKKEEDIHDRQ